jgi:hypothetical protein
MCNWTPEGFIGEMFMTTSRHAPPPPGLAPPVGWGTEERLGELFGDGVSELRCERKLFKLRFLSPDHFIDFYRQWFGPTKMAFERVGEDGAAGLAADYRELLERHNVADDGLILPAEYLEVVATRAG